MASAADTLTGFAGVVATGADRSIFDEIRRVDVAMTVWRREIEAGLAAWLDALPSDRLPDQRFITPRNRAADAIAEACATAPECRERTALVADVSAVVDRYCEATLSSQVRVRLEAISDDACRRFHQDAVSARLLCTYRGAGTEWGYAERGAAPEKVHQLSRGDVAVLKGASVKSGLDHHVLHRSPPIEGAGVTRLLLVVDPVDWEEGADLSHA
ncbi:MAG: DUF1826 domain-containing protein [Neomegalonema sp.]|nr:DUF1826 domain-containing protein [Neomegalonema sp.]